MISAKNKKLSIYLIWAFALAWILQVTASILYLNGNSMAYTIILSVSMFAPLVAVLLSKVGLKEMSWKLRIKGNIPYILGAWFVPPLLGIAGAALYFLIFPQAFDTDFSFLLSQIGEEGMAQLEATGMSPSAYIILSSLASLTWAPWFNMLFAVGEEAGWRGAMYPILKERFGKAKGRIIGGIIWGVWHWPIMILVGYEYGTSYWGYPVTGPLLFCVITTAMGILLDYFYEKANSIWVPALGHGAINAFAGVPALFLNPAYSDQLLVGPLMIGVIGGLPLILSAIIISIKSLNPKEGQITSV